MTPPRPVVLCILDGWGLSDAPEHNAPFLANTPYFDDLMARCPSGTLRTHGPDVGLPSGQMGNSEVGHTNIGAGRVVSMDLGQIDLAIEQERYGQNPELVAFIETLKKTGGAAHLIGVLSDGGVHGHIAHLKATIEILSAHDIPVIVHAITDGRDVAPKSARSFLERFCQDLPKNARIATLIGRYFAMDRDQRWERVASAYYAITYAKGAQAPSALGALQNAYDAGQTDEFIEPSVIGDYQGIAAGDGIFCLNFRADRAREILAALGDPAFEAFDRSLEAKEPPNLSVRLGMVDYSAAHNHYMRSCFPKQEIKNTLGEWVAAQGKTQFRVAETEKYPHVTFFLNGGVETPFEGEARAMPPSPKVATYDLCPQMAAADVTRELCGAIKSRYDLIVVNFANPDMVGHTGDLSAAIQACEAVDAGLGAAIPALQEVGGAMVVTADHGNCETMYDAATGGAHTAHTLNVVPVMLLGADDRFALRRDGRLADLAPTVLELMNLPIPEEMTGQSLLCPAEP